MAVIVGGHETGLLNTSLATLDRGDLTDNAPNRGDDLYVNISILSMTPGRT